MPFQQSKHRLPACKTNRKWQLKVFCATFWRNPRSMFPGIAQKAKWLRDL